MELLLCAQHRHELSDGTGGLLERVRERQRNVMPPALIHEGIMPTDEQDDPEEDLRTDPWAEDWET